MHGGHSEPTNTPTVGITWTNSHRPIKFPVLFSPGDRVWCNKAHYVTFTERMVFNSMEELTVYACDCLEQGGISV